MDSLIKDTYYRAIPLFLKSPFSQKANCLIRIILSCTIESYYEKMQRLIIDYHEKFYAIALSHNS